jgi:lysophospholipase L1-like esterase
MNKKFYRAVGIVISLLIVFLVAAFSAASAMHILERDFFPAYYNKKVREFNAENRTAQKGGVIFVGDSLTDGCDLSVYYPGLNAYNRGIGGDTAIGVLKRMDESIFDLEPQLIVILIGVNDLARGYSTQFLFDNLNKILTQIKERLPDAKVILQTLYPVNPEILPAVASLMPNINVVNTRIPFIISAFSGYRYVNVFDALIVSHQNKTLKPEYTTDGLHLSDAGYKAVAAVLRPVIDQLLAE